MTLNPMYWPARRQETLLTTAVYNFHPPSPTRSTTSGWATWKVLRATTAVATLEGGDVMPIGKGVAVIGMGERSRIRRSPRWRATCSPPGRRADDHRQPPEVPAPRCTSTPCSRSATTTW